MRVFSEKIRQRMGKEYPGIPDKTMDYLLLIGKLDIEVHTTTVAYGGFKAPRSTHDAEGTQEIVTGLSIYLIVPEDTLKFYRAEKIPVPPRLQFFGFTGNKETLFVTYTSQQFTEEFMLKWGRAPVHFKVSDEGKVDVYV